MACSHSKHCELFAQFALNPALKIWQTHFCEAEFTQCARFQLSKQGKPVPLNLLPNGKKVEAPRTSSAYGAAALFNAILKDRLNMVQSLLRTGVDINTRGPEGITPLMAAASIGNPDIIQLLLAKGGDVNAVNAQGETAFDIAMRSGHPDEAALLRAGLGAPAPLAEVPPLAAVAAAPAEVAPAVPEPVDPVPVTPPAPALAAVPKSQSARPFYVRVRATHPTEVATQIRQICRTLDIGLDCLVQKGAASGQGATSIIMLTAPTTVPLIVKAVRQIEILDSIVSEVVCMRLDNVHELEEARVSS
ncbi:MAG TPA: ankyrin repeat domain-containing protein [Acidiferrobacterales bacterium]